MPRSFNLFLQHHSPLGANFGQQHSDTSKLQYLVPAASQLGLGWMTGVHKSDFEILIRSCVPIKGRGEALKPKSL